MKLSFFSKFFKNTKALWLKALVLLWVSAIYRCWKMLCLCHSIVKYYYGVMRLMYLPRMLCELSNKKILFATTCFLFCALFVTAEFMTEMAMKKYCFRAVEILFLYSIINRYSNYIWINTLTILPWLTNEYQ